MNIKECRIRIEKEIKQKTIYVLSEETANTGKKEQNRNERTLRGLSH
jgi:hypothetical protein